MDGTADPYSYPDQSPLWPGWSFPCTDAQQEFELDGNFNSWQSSLDYSGLGVGASPTVESHNNAENEHFVDELPTFESVVEAVAIPPLLKPNSELYSIKCVTKGKKSRRAKLSVKYPGSRWSSHGKKLHRFFKEFGQGQPKVVKRAPSYRTKKGSCVQDIHLTEETIVDLPKCDEVWIACRSESSIAHEELEGWEHVAGHFYVDKSYTRLRFLWRPPMIPPSQISEH